MNPFDRTIHSSDDARRLARRRLPWMVFGYIDGKAGTEHGAALNRGALADLRLRQRVLVDVSERDLSVDVFGKTSKAPFGISPMGMCNLSHPDGDMALARIAAKLGAPHCVSTVASTSMEKIIEAAEGNAWFQLYFSGDGSGALKLVERAEKAGYETLILTVDVPVLGRRTREIRHGFKTPFRIGPSQFIDFACHPHWSLRTLFRGKPQLANFDDEEYTFDRTESRAKADWSYLKRLRDAWKGNLVVKGVLDPEDAVRLKAEGVDAVQVSSHGGRQLDGAPEPILALRDIRRAVGDDCPLFYDTGIRSGEDVAKAYAMGADFVFLGRILQFALAANGETGLNQLWSVMTEEFDLAMAQMGQVSPAGLKYGLVD